MISEKKIIGWLTLKELPEIPAFTFTDKRLSRFLGDGWIWEGGEGETSYEKSTLEKCADFFLPVYESEQVCSFCKGASLFSLPGGTELKCKICNGTRKVSIAPPKKKCVRCGGSGGKGEWTVCPSCNGTGTKDWEWPPEIGQKIFFSNFKSGEIEQDQVRAVGTKRPIILELESRRIEVLNVSYPSLNLAQEAVDLIKRHREENGI